MHLAKSDSYDDHHPNREQDSSQQEKSQGCASGILLEIL